MATLRRQPERAEQANIVRLLRSLGATVYVLGTTRRKGDYHGTMQTPGLPDLLAFVQCPDVGAVELIAIEVKAPGGRLRSEQRVFGDLCAMADVDHIVGGLDAVVDWLIMCGVLRDRHTRAYTESSVKVSKP